MTVRLDAKISFLCLGAIALTRISAHKMRKGAPSCALRTEKGLKMAKYHRWRAEGRQIYTCSAHGIIVSTPNLSLS